MDKQSEKLLGESVRRILENADMTLMTESKVRKLAAEDTGLDLNVPANRKVVKRIIEEFFVEKDDGSDDADENGSEGGEGEEEEEEEEEHDVKAKNKRSKHSAKEKRRVIIDDDSEDEPERTSSRSSLRSMNKKRTSTGKQRVVVSEGEDEEEEEEEGDDDSSEENPIKKRGKSSFERNDSGDLVVCQLGSKRMVTIQGYRGKLFVSIREYYEKDGKQLPTPKGISLSIEEWKVFKGGLRDIQTAVKRIQHA